MDLTYSVNLWADELAWIPGGVAMLVTVSTFRDSPSILMCAFGNSQGYQMEYQIL